MKSRKLSRKRRRATVVGASAAAVVAGVALIPNWSAGAAVTDDPTVDASTKATFQKLADAVFTDRTQALVDGSTSAHTHHTAGFSGSVRLSGGQTREQSSALGKLRARKTLLAKLGEKYSAGDTKVTLDATEVHGRSAKVAVTETTTLTYKKGTVPAKGPKTTGFQAHHELTFKAGRHGDWQLTGIHDTDDGYLAVNQVEPPATSSTPTTPPTGGTSPSPSAPSTGGTSPSPTATPTGTPSSPSDDGPPDAPRAATSYPAPANPKQLTGGAYDYKAMVAYAQKYWNHYNPDYPDYNGAGAGGDCTNFVSQVLKAGGWKHVPGYTDDYTKWFGNADIQSDSFVGVNEFSWFALSSKRVTPLANVYQADLGDVIQMDFDRDGSKDHSMVVTYRDGSGVPYVTYHSTNTYNRSVASLVASYPTAYFYAYRT
ncbi:amidase domain-containing protein [Streptomyces misionensis]|uniref:amidase domain-containing protein n=1 Tax=Streptomyces TaxID=1883 RepID=UPI00340E10EF